MTTILRLALTASIAAVLAACNTTPDRIEALESARTMVPQVEASPRAGVAASQISGARASLDVAERLERSGGQRVAIEHEATVAVLNAQIAQEKILTAEAQEALAKGTEERQTVLISSRDREVTQRTQETEINTQAADAAKLRTSELEREVAIERAKH
jgi:ATP-dependent protease ClpP protease subunit